MTYPVPSGTTGFSNLSDKDECAPLPALLALQTTFALIFLGGSLFLHEVY